MLQQRWYNVVSTLYKVFLTLFQHRVLTLYQRCTTLKIRRRNLFHFQRRINVISMLIHNVEPTSKCWLGNIRIRISILDILCVPMFSQNGQLWIFLAQICPKIDLGLETEESNVKIRITIVKILCVPIFSQDEQL